MTRQRSRAASDAGREDAESPRPGAPARGLIFLVRVYQVALSPLLGGHCRFHPTCSHYASEALTRHGARRGGWLTFRRLLRCHPFGGAGFDPVPAERQPSTAKKRSPAP